MIIHPVVAIRQVVPSVGIAEGVCGEPLAVVGAVVAEEEGVAQGVVHLGLAGEEDAVGSAVAEGGEGSCLISAVVERPLGGSQNVVEEGPAVGGQDGASAVGVRLVQIVHAAPAYQRQPVPEELRDCAVRGCGGTELPVQAVGIGTYAFCVGDGEDLVHPAIEEAAFALADQASRRVVGAVHRGAITRRA